jgi:hypothetical protein
MTWLYFVQTGIYQVILCTAWDILRNTTLYLESGSSRLASPFCLGCPLVPCIACDFLPLPSLLDGQAPKAGLAAPKLPQPRVDFVYIAAPSSVQSSSVGTAKWEARFLHIKVWEAHEILHIKVYLSIYRYILVYTSLYTV